jgi:hypothetical protein
VIPPHAPQVPQSPSKVRLHPDVDPSKKAANTDFGHLVREWPVSPLRSPRSLGGTTVPRFGEEPRELLQSEPFPTGRTFEYVPRTPPQPGQLGAPLPRVGHA